MPFLLGIGAVREHEKAIPIAHPDRSIIRPKLEYPTVDVNLTYLSSINKTKGILNHPRRPSLVTIDSFTNKAIESLSHGNLSFLIARVVGVGNFYFTQQYSGEVTADFGIGKCVAANWTKLASEAVDFGAHHSFRIKLRCIGTTIEGYRVDMITNRVSITDATFASGWFGFCQSLEKGGYFSPEWTYLRGSPSNPPKTIAYFEAPIIGSGKEEDPFRAKLPEKIIEDKTLGKRNLLSVSHSSLIPTDTKGYPRNPTTLVRVFDQPDRDSALDLIDTCLKEIEASIGVKKLIKAHAIKRAKEMDPKLTDYDLLLHPSPTRGDIEDLIKHKEKTFEIKLTEEEAIEELKYDKVW